METTFIYALCEPHSRMVRYIGKADRPAYRFKQHLRQSVRAKTHLGNWLRSLLSLGEKPALVVLREVPDAHREIAEERYIRIARSLGMKLVNGTDGGDGCHRPPPETRAKMGSGWRGKRRSEDSKEKMSTAKKGIPKTPEQNAANRAAQLGERNHMFGQTHTPEACDKISAAKKGRRPSEATLAAASAVTKGVPKSAEHNAKNSAAQKLVWAARKAAQV